MAQTITVPDDYPTIQEAVDNAAPGDTINVRAGTYYEHVAVNKSLILVGEDPATTIIDGSGTGDLISVPFSAAAKLYVTRFTLQHGAVGFYCSGLFNSFTVEDCRLVDNDVGISAYDCPGLTGLIKDNLVSNNTSCGISLHWSGAVISGNTITHNGALGIWVTVEGGGRISDNEISNNGNGDYSHGGVGLFFYSAAEFIRNNHITHNNGSGIITHKSDAYIFNNTLSSNLRHGVSTENSGIVTIEHNLIANNTESGVHIANEATGRHVLNNRIVNNTDGVKLRWWYTNNRIEGNLIADNEHGAYISDTHVGAVNWFFHNNFITNTHPVLFSYPPPPFGPGYSNVTWDAGYPSGGNYWSTYSDTDLSSGPLQDQAGGDGLGDTPYVLDENNTDVYPLMTPYSPTDERTTSIAKGGVVYQIQLTTNTTILAFNETPGAIKLSVTGDPSTGGYMRIVQPVGLNATTIRVFLNNTRLTFPSSDPPRSISTNGSHYFVYFAFSFSSCFEVTTAFPIRGDATYDGVVDIFDCVTKALAFGATPLEAHWNAHADLLADDIIDIYDLVIVAITLGDAWPA